MVINVTRQRVKEFVIDPPASDADYRLEASPGMIVIEDDYNAPQDEQTVPGARRKMFRVADNGSWKEIASGGRQSAEQQMSWMRRYWLGLTLGVLAALLVGAGALWMTRRRRARPPLGPAAPAT